MININYEIERDEGDEIKFYRPDKLPKEFNNLSYIKAPNSTGKSTLLHLLALGFYANKLSENELEKSLRRKIDNLLDLEHQKITFDITVDNPIIGWKLMSSKPNPNSTDISVKLYKDGQEKFLGSETFFKHFRLIYDIPYDPLERLPQLLQEVKTQQIDIGQKIGQFRERLRYLIAEVRNSRDPEVLEEYQNKLEILVNEKEKIDRKARILKNQSSKLLEYYLSRFYLETIRGIKNHKNNLEELENELDTAKKEGRSNARKLNNLDKRILKQKEITIEQYNNLYILLSQMIPQKDKDHLELWKDTNISNEIYKPDLYKNIRKQNQIFINIFTVGLQNQKRIFSDDIEKIDFYHELLSTLTDNRFQNLKLPGIDQTVNSFKKLINDELDKFKEVEESLNNLEKMISRITEFDKSLKSTIKLVREFSKLNNEQSPSTSGRDIQAINDDIWATKGIIKKLDDKADRLRNNLIGNHFDPPKTAARLEILQEDEDLKNLIFMNEEKILEKVTKSQSNFLSVQSQLKKYDELIDSQKDAIEEMELKDPHEYRKCLGKLVKFSEIAARLQQRFVSHYKTWINSVIEGKNLNDDEKQYAKFLGEFLATKISTIKHVEETYKVVNIDMAKRMIITEESKEIKFDDIGTGQSQAAFLQGKLAMNDDRKIIALLDEVAMMDETTLEPIKNRLRSLYENKKLFMAIIVQKSEEVRIEDLS